MSGLGAHTENIPSPQLFWLYFIPMQENTRVNTILFICIFHSSNDLFLFLLFKDEETLAAAKNAAMDIMAPAKRSKRKYY